MEACSFNRLLSAVGESWHWSRQVTGGEEGEGAAEEPREVHLQWILRRCIYSDIKVCDLVRRRGDHVDGRGGGQTVASQDRGIQVVSAIFTVAFLLVSMEGPHHHLGVRHQPVHPRLHGQSPDV